MVQAFQIGQDFTLAFGVQRRQRLIEQHQARAGQQGPRDADTLTLTSGQLFRATFQQMIDAEQFGRLLQLDAALWARDAFQAEFQVGAYRQVRKQAGFLKDIADCALVRGQKDSVFAVLPDLAMNANKTLFGFFQPGDATQAGGLARTRRAEQCRDA